jgi:hypothetical protein
METLLVALKAPTIWILKVGSLNTSVLKKDTEYHF